MELPVSIGPVSMRGVRAHRKESALYPPSWIDRLTDWVDHLKGPAWVYYLAVVVVAVGVQLAIAWWGGSYRHEIIGFAVVLTASSVYYLAMIHYLDKMAAGAVVKFCPSMCLAEQNGIDLTYRLTHLPARIVRLVTLVGIALAMLMIIGVEQGVVEADLGFFGTSKAAQLWWRIVLIIDQIFFWNMIYHTIHQLRVVNLIYDRYAKIDLFNLSPLYSFSRLTAYTAVSTIVIAYMWVATFPWLSTDYLVIGSWLIGIAAAMAGFILPLLGIHSRLVEEKQRWTVDAGQSLKVSMTNLHQSIAERKLEEVELLVKAMEGVHRQQAILEQIPTWPWQPGTVRGMTTTVLVPIFLWVVLRVLERLLIF